MALTFGAASSDRVVIDAGIDNEHAFTVLMWHYPTTVTAQRRFWDKGVDIKGLSIDPSSRMEMKVGRATTNAFATLSGSLSTGSWQFAACTFDTTDGPRIFTGALDTTASEPAYSRRDVGAGAASSDSGGPFCIGGIEVGSPIYAFEGRIAIFAHFKRRLTLQEIIAWQFRPFVDADTDIFIELGYNGTGTQPNLTSLGNGIDGTVTGATVGDHVPLPPRFGFDVPVIPVRAGVFGAASLGMVLGVVSSATRKTFGAASLPLVASIVSSGVRKTFSSASLGLLANIVSSAKATRFGAASASFVLNISSSVASGFRLTAVSESTLTLATESEDSSQSLTPKAEDSSLTLTALEEFS